jgi:peptide chain release factor 1
LFATYLKYARLQGLTAELLNSETGHIIAKVTGVGAGKAFQHEPGKHIVQRIPPTEARGRKQTSVVVVGVLPLPPDTSFQDIPEAEFEITTTKGKVKAGGQNQNKVESAVRIVHPETGLTVFICNERSQHANKREALRIIRARVNELRQNQSGADYNAIRRAQMQDGSRSGKVRTYNFLESRVVDHRLNKKTGNVKGVMNGKFDFLFKD